MKISVFGAGYVGLVTSVCFAELGHSVVCCDVDVNKIDLLNNGQVPFYEPGLEEILSRNIASQKILFTSNGNEAAIFGEIIFIAVGTPPLEYGQADMQYVYQVAEKIGQNINADRRIVVTKSTVPVGTANEIEQILSTELKKRNLVFEFDVVSNPEFLKEGEAILDFLRPDRIVIGVETDWARKKMEDLYFTFIHSGYPVYFMDVASSEMSKYAANTMLATKISLMNQISNLCEMVNADIEEVKKAIAADKRIGPHFINPGVGFGGSCFPKDVQALAVLAKKHGYSADMIESVERVNEKQKELLANKIIKELGDLEGKKIAIWGLAFKPNTDDVRDAPSITIIEKLLSKGAKIIAYDPVAMTTAKKVLNNRIEYSSDMYECLNQSDCLAVVTEWSQFKDPDFEKIKTLLKQPIIFDGRNIYSPQKMKENGFKYISIGRGKIN